MPLHLACSLLFLIFSTLYICSSQTTRFTKAVTIHGVQLKPERQRLKPSSMFLSLHLISASIFLGVHFLTWFFLRQLFLYSCALTSPLIFFWIEPLPPFFRAVLRRFRELSARIFVGRMYTCVYKYIYIYVCVYMYDFLPASILTILYRPFLFTPSSLRRESSKLILLTTVAYGFFSNIF